jgi:hypothetical protein
MSKKKPLRLERTPTVLWLTSPYSPKFVDALKSLGGGKWIPELKMWLFPLSAEHALVALCQDMWMRYPEVADVPEKEYTEAKFSGRRLKAPGTTPLGVTYMKPSDTTWITALAIANQLRPLMLEMTDEEKEWIYELLFNQH